MNAEQAISRLREVVRRQHKAISTESTYVFWLRRYMLAIPRYPEELTSQQELERFLTELARDRGVSAISQNQAFNAVCSFTGMSPGTRFKTWTLCARRDQSACGPHRL